MHRVGIYYICGNGILAKNVLRRISANANHNPNSNNNPKPKAQKPFRENKMTSFSGNCPDRIE